MNYPTIEKVESAGREQLGRWSRFLPSPGSSAIYDNNFDAQLKKEKVVLDRILERFEALGGWSASLSKQIGWQ